MNVITTNKNSRKIKENCREVKWLIRMFDKRPN
jgi:DNA-directed RNA polymerase specialized sigma54-like protein